ncbi:hypothetical protein COCVIDRAFT_31939 [Bipolaris victoriae FI3]|uniref:Serine hydrolase domain-containing protein n=1 Tax=Bipolaris victoriae (strain FI3) TaxID=930091 RepID=W7E0T7_BIPV3|nr:hypothetical protein COCVIDRAFT_31939 [Bipolaris victoriae FI3]
MSTYLPLYALLKILMLHGYTQSGLLFQAKTDALRKILQKDWLTGCEIVCPTAPIQLSPAGETFLTIEDGNEEEIDAWASWKRKGEGEAYTYDSLEQGLVKIVEVLD